MPLSRLLKSVSLILLCLLLTNCASIKPPDKPLCVPITMDRGFCVDVISGRQYDVDETHKIHDDLAGVDRTWWEMKPYMIYMPPGTWAAYKKFLITVCKKTGKCNNKELASWNQTIQTVDKKMEEKGVITPPTVP